MDAGRNDKFILWLFFLFLKYFREEKVEKNGRMQCLEEQ